MPHLSHTDKRSTDQVSVTERQMEGLVEIATAAALVQQTAQDAIAAPGVISRSFGIYDVMDRVRDLVAVSAQFHTSNAPPREAK